MFPSLDVLGHCLEPLQSTRSYYKPYLASTDLTLAQGHVHAHFAVEFRHAAELPRGVRIAVPLLAQALFEGAWGFAGECVACRRSTTDYVCGACARASALAHGPALITSASSGEIGRVYACALYLTAHAEPSPLAAALRRFKYTGDRLAGRRLTAVFARHVTRSAATYDCVVPVPLHPARLRERGFNQAAWLSRALARTLGIPHDYRRLRRIGTAVAQAGTRRPARMHNVRNAFEARAPYSRPTRVLLVDDVVTTGATAGAAAAALRCAGAACIDLAVLLRTPAVRRR